MYTARIRISGVLVTGGIKLTLELKLDGMGEQTPSGFIFPASLEFL